MSSRNSIAKWRNLRDVSQDKLAKHLGINRALLSQIETGKVLPSTKMLIEMARFLDCLITDLYREGDNDR
jgi:DNA-binding XRE family transcriptional regulator